MFHSSVFILLFCSAALTAGHCVCGVNRNIGEPCRLGDDKNQITPNNKISVKNPELNAATEEVILEASVSALT